MLQPGEGHFKSVSDPRVAWALTGPLPASDRVSVPVEDVIPDDSDVLSKRVGNYQYSPAWGMLFDQLWVR